MRDTLDKAFYISATTNRDLVLYKNIFDNSIHLFAFVEFIQKTANTPYHEFVGKDITYLLSTLNDQTFDTNAFEYKLETLATVSIKSADNVFLWIKATNPVK